jgi:hypothetical protein
MKKIKKKGLDVGAPKNSGPRVRPTLVERNPMQETPLTEEEMEAAFPEGQDHIRFDIAPHPITNEPQFVLKARSKNGDQADVRMSIGEAINLGAQITAQATSFVAVQQFAGLMAAQQQQGIVRP